MPRRVSERALRARFPPGRRVGIGLAASVRYASLPLPASFRLRLGDGATCRLDRDRDALMVARQPRDGETKSFAGLLLRHRRRTGLTQRDVAGSYGRERTVRSGLGGERLPPRRQNLTRDGSTADPSAG